MTRFSVSAALASVLLLAACDRAQNANDRAGSFSAKSQPVDEAVSAKASEHAGPSTAEPASGALGPALAPDAERGVKGARDILLSFARAIERGDYGRARAMLSVADRQRWSVDDFGAMFTDLHERSVAIAEGTIEGAAGSSYYTAPIAITGSDKDGRPVRTEGEAVLRRVNDVDGADPAQLRWHFETLTLNWTH